MGIFFGLIIMLVLACIFGPCLVIRVILNLTLDCYPDKTSPEAAVAVRRVANGCTAVSLAGIVWFYCWATSGPGPHGVEPLIPGFFWFLCLMLILSVFAAVVPPLRVKAPVSRV